MSEYDMYTIIKQVNYVKKHYNFDYNKETKPVLDKNTSVEIYPKIGDRLYRINKKEIKDYFRTLMLSINGSRAEINPSA